jgi:hypothetical protein
MWTITDEQLTKISQSMREEFEKRAFYVLSKENCTTNILERDIRQNISKQMERIMRYNITNEEYAIEFIRLSFIHPILQEQKWDEFLEKELFNDEKSNSEKIEILSNYTSVYSTKR